MVSHDIVVVGANIAGILAAHYLLKHTIPALQDANKSVTYKLTLISPSTHFFWKIGAPHALINSELIPFSKIFKPIGDGFKQYPKDKFTLVIGSAVGVDQSQKTVTVQTADSGTKTVSYSALVIATGTTSASPLWTLHGSHETTISSMKELHAALPNASTILISGGGPTGVETAGQYPPRSFRLNSYPLTTALGEIATVFPKADTTILSGTHSLLHRLKPAIGEAAESTLKRMNVKTINNAKVTAATPSADNRKTTVQLSDNTSRTVDVYIDATGGRPNTSFLPSAWLNERGYVLTDPKSLRLLTAANVYAVGDVASYSAGSAIDAMEPIRPLCSSILADLSPDGKAVKQTPYNKSEKMTQLVPIGPKGGVGMLFGWRVPSLMVWGVKSRTFFVELVEPLVSGARVAKA